MKPLSALDLGFSDAENYKRHSKDLFSRVFFRNQELDQLCEDRNCFLVGEKGTGKTAYAVYLANNYYKDISGSLVYIRETDYQTFMDLKRRKGIHLADYTSIWRAILLLLVAQKISDNEPKAGDAETQRSFSRVQTAISEYYQSTFTPEISSALIFTNEPDRFARVIHKHLLAGGHESTDVVFNRKRFQINLDYIEQKLREAVLDVHTSKRHTIFIDGIDIRPASVAYNDYRECIAGLANATWSVNNDVFAKMRKAQKPPRVVVLVRPDILESLGLQNTNTKLRDNSVVLDWRTTYPQYRRSDIFHAIDQLLSAQQDQKHIIGKCWDHYFPFNSPTHGESSDPTTSFISFLRFSLLRPRDIIVMMDILRKMKLSAKDDSPIQFETFNRPVFRRRYAEYLLGEIKDQVSFYHTKREYEAFLKFFEFLNGKAHFDYSFFCGAYDSLMGHLSSIRMQPPDFFEGANRFLQYLFDLNVISYVEKMDDGKKHIHWCYRERSYANISPKVKSGLRYEIHYGLAKALNLGKRMRTDWHQE